MGKIVSQDELILLTAHEKRNGRRVVFTNGCFDLLHPGHVRCLAEARALGCKVYRLSQEPFKFQDAVVAGTQENYYGECKFQIDTDTPQYVKMDRNSLKGLFGKFNPSTGDLVFSRTGDLLGLMANNNYCLVLRSFNPGLSLRFGPAGNSELTAQTLSTLYAVVFQMPFRLQ